MVLHIRIYGASIRAVLLMHKWQEEERKPTAQTTSHSHIVQYIYISSANNLVNANTSLYRKIRKSKRLEQQYNNLYVHSHIQRRVYTHSDGGKVVSAQIHAAKSFKVNAGKKQFMFRRLNMFRFEMMMKI